MGSLFFFLQEDVKMWKDEILGFTSMSGERIEVHYYIKVYDQPSKYGINNWGKI